MKNKEVKEQQVQAEVEQTTEQVAQTDEKQIVIDELVKENEQLIAANDKLAKTVARLQSSADNSDKFRDQLVALKSDFDSYKRRMRSDAEAQLQKGRMEVVEAVLPVLDTFDIAKAHLDEANLKAFEMVANQFVSILSSFGVEILDVAGQPFDPATMNALSTMDRGEENSGKVVEVYKKGYVCQGKVVRYAEVIVGK